MEQKLSQFTQMLQIIMDSHPLITEIRDSVPTERELVRLSHPDRYALLDNYWCSILRTGHLGFIKWFYNSFPHMTNETHVILNVCQHTPLTESVIQWCYDVSPGFRPSDVHLLQASTWHHYNIIYDIMRGRWGSFCRTANYGSNISSFACSIKDLDVMERLLNLGFYENLIELLRTGNNDPYSLLLYAIKGRCHCNNDNCSVHDSYFYVDSLDFYVEALQRYLGSDFSWMEVSRVLVDSYFDILTERSKVVFLDHCHSLILMHEPVPQRIMLQGLIHVLSGPSINIDIVRYLEVRIVDFSTYDLDDFVGEMTVDGFRHMTRIFGGYMTDYSWITIIMVMILRGHIDNLVSIIDDSPHILDYITVDNLCEFMHRSETVPRANVLHVLLTLKPDLNISDPDIFFTMRRVIQDNVATYTGSTVRRPMHRHCSLDYIVHAYPDIYRQVVYVDNPPFWSDEWFREVAYLAADEEPEVPLPGLNIEAYIQDREEECNICYLKSRPVAVLCKDTSSDTTYRGHIFCIPCIRAWLSQRETCPLCRRNIAR